VKFAFRAVPEPGGASLRPRPVLDVIVEGLELAPQACLLDSGATAIRMGLHVAELTGLDLREAPSTTLAVGGMRVTARMQRVTLEVSDGSENHRWEAPVWFCEDWTPSFGLLGLTGFFDHFIVTISAYDERFEIQPR
jgi:hypothetical protein